MTTGIEIWQHHTWLRALRRRPSLTTWGMHPRFWAYQSGLTWPQFSVFRGPDDTRLAAFRRTHAQALELASDARLYGDLDECRKWVEFAQSFRRLQP